MSKLILLTTLQRLEGWDTTTELMFGAAITVSTDDGLPVNDSGLKPWEWTGGISGIRFVILAADGTAVPGTPKTASLFPGASSSQKKALEHFFKNLGTEYQFSKTEDPTNLKWAPMSFDPASTKPTYSVPVAQNKARPWHALLGKISTYPFPIPQAGNLSFLFTVSKSDLAGGTRIVGAPVISQGKFPSATLTPQNSPIPDGTDARAYVWPYDGLANWPVVAYVAPISITETLPPSFINRKTQWVEVQNSNVFSDDWMAYVEDRLADGFDLSQRIIEFLEANSSRLGDSDSQTLVEMTLASTRDIAGYGLDPAPGSTSLIQRLLTKNSNGQLSTADLALLQQTAKKLDTNLTLSTWKAALAAAVPEFTSLSVFNGSVSDRPLPSRSAVELRNLHGRLFNTEGDANLRQLMKTQWQILSQETKLQGREGIADVLAQASLGTNLRRGLALSNLGRFWKDFIQSNTDKNDKLGDKLITNCLVWYFQWYAAGRLGLPAPTVQPDIKAANGFPTFSPKVTSALTPDCAKALLEFIGKWAASYGAALKPSPSQPANAVHPIVFQVGRMEAMPQESQSSFGDDPMEGFSGIGVLLREKRSSGTGDWLCLNMAKGETYSTAIPLPSPFLAPCRITFKSELRQATISYNNQPLATNSPLSKRGIASRALVGDLKGRDALLEYVYSETSQIPGLKYGSSYEARPFVVANSGALPVAIGKRQSPCELDPAKLKALRPGPWSPIPYLRRIPVGAFKMEFTDEKGNEIFPSIPNDVFPRARDIASLSTGAPSPGPSKSYRETHLLLLADLSGMSHFTLRFKRPTTTWDNWSRWVAFDANSEDLRAKIIADYFRIATLNEQFKGKATGYDQTLDDPALADANGNAYLHIQLEVCSENGSMSPVGTPVFLKMPALSAPPVDLASARAKSLDIPCQWVASDQKTRITDDGNLFIKEGDVARVTVSVCIPEENWKRFDQNILPSPPPLVTSGTNAKFYRVAPLEILIESADFRLPTELELWNAFRTGSSRNSNGAAVLATLSGPGNFFRNLHRAELRRQIWRWQGRDTAPHPMNELVTFGQASADPPISDRIRRWEAVEFGDRPESDFLLMEMKGDPPSPNGTLSFRYEEVLESASGDSKASGARHDLRSLHYRFSVTAFSRYEQLLKRKNQTVFASVHAHIEVSPDSGKQVLNTNAASEAIEQHWKYAFVPCRRTADIPVPRLRLILPLTEPVIDNDGSAGKGTNFAPTPGLLVVLNEPWHEVGGLAEQLQVEIDTTPNENPALGQDMVYDEVGPDPISSSEPYFDKPRKKDEHAPILIDQTRIHGPVGHYFDASNTAAYFPVTSFVVPAPSTSDTSKIDFSWYFAKLRLRRVLTVCDGAFDNYTRSDDKCKLELKYSAWTDPVWAQFLAPFSILDEHAWPMSALRLLKKNSTLSELSLVDASGRPQHLEPFHPETGFFSLFLVLTRKVFDVTGQANQEQYIGFYRPSNDVWTAVDILSDAGESCLGLRARIIEVQSPTKIEGKSLWTSLFGQTGSKNKDVQARIVRISDPIDEASESVPNCEVQHVN
jgi:hypothetical protein